jgi:hypothetical protein
VPGWARGTDFVACIRQRFAIFDHATFVAQVGQNLLCLRHTSTTANPLNLAQDYMRVKLCAEYALKDE